MRGKRDVRRKQEGEENLVKEKEGSGRGERIKEAREKEGKSERRRKMKGEEERG